MYRQKCPAGENRWVHNRVHSTTTFFFFFYPFLQFDKHINTVVQRIVYQLRSTAKLKHFLSFKGHENVIHAIISSCLDYCYSLYVGLPQSTMSLLQMVQNVVARLLMGTTKRNIFLWFVPNCIGSWLNLKFYDFNFFSQNGSWLYLGSPSAVYGL